MVPLGFVRDAFLSPSGFSLAESEIVDGTDEDKQAVGFVSSRLAGSAEDIYQMFRLDVESEENVSTGYCYGLVSN